MGARNKITVVGAGNVGATAAHWLAAKELGGSLVARSDGLGKGATFTLELPILPGVGLGAPGSLPLRHAAREGSREGDTSRSDPLETIAPAPQPSLPLSAGEMEELYPHVAS